MGITVEEHKTKLKLRAKLLLIVVIFLLAMPALTIGSLRYIEEPDFCGLCHTMKPYHNSWKKSGHSRINCYSCHADSESREETAQIKDEEIIPRYMLTTNKAVKAFGKTVEFISRYSDVVANYIDTKRKQLAFLFTVVAGHSDQANRDRVWDRCLNCHGDLMFSQTGKDYYGHFKHAGSGVITCKQCHGDLVHGRKPEITRQQCLECHDKKIGKPPSHAADNFKTSHGRDYLAKKNCRLCHVRGVQEPLCQNCHKVQMPHPENYKERHIQAIEEVGVRTCFNCHEARLEQGPADPKQPADTASCSVCHGRKMPHTKDIVKTHTTLVEEQGTKNCNYCHQTSPRQKDMAVACVDCHGLEMPHPPGFKYRHKDVYYAKGQAVCNLCHSPANPANPGAPWTSPNFCIDCHMKNKPHPPGFNIQHQLGGYDRNRCVICHPAVVHCNECHFGE
ncbi:cytochrome c3 family protein [Thermincola potens]|uniref:NapC/NirT cytochrome c N-terminal domain-containing protein n=1 Tax=Thermincola potens (strain JR) TaxID=635013 RepID=D5X910_THEPJ|nr:cytochrome c3 family protein [Thermincola potens]ADG81010.1 hypothetical protein TherJR_0117 [Thermincola potens JR]